MLSRAYYSALTPWLAEDKLLFDLRRTSMSNEKDPAASDAPAPAAAEEELKVDEVSKVVGGTENIKFGYGSPEIQYVKQNP